MSSTLLSFVAQGYFFNKPSSTLLANPGNQQGEVLSALLLMIVQFNQYHFYPKGEPLKSLSSIELSQPAAPYDRYNLYLNWV